MDGFGVFHCSGAPVVTPPQGEYAHGGVSEIVKSSGAQPDPDVVRSALQAFEFGHIALAEAMCRRMVLRSEQNATVWNLIGRVALKIHRPHEAADAFRRALELEPSLKPARKNLALAEAELAKPAPSTPAISPISRP